MGYNVFIYRSEVKSKEQNFEGQNFFDHTDNLLPFTSEQKEKLENLLLNYGYLPLHTVAPGKEFEHKKLKGVYAMLTDHGLYFRSDLTEQGAFEISMTATEFTETNEFAKYDPQDGGWEEF